MVRRGQRNVTRRISMTTRKELVEALRLRYRSAAFSDRVKILDEFVALTCYHRKHAIRVLRGELSPATEVRLRNRVYDEAVAQALTVLWEAADRVCGKRLKPLIPMLVDAMERHGHLDLDPVIKTKVLQVSAATIDRVLAATRAHIDGQRKRRKGVGSAIRRSIPVRTFADWLDPPPGFFEIDMVEHCGGPKTDGDYVHTLTMTDIATGWTECVAMRVREQMLVIEAFDKVAAELPFPMLGVDSDNDSAFMSQSVFDYCKGHGLVQTRSRAYKKNDQAWVEQKNGAVVRRLVGYGRLSGVVATKALAQLYPSSRLYINFFLPSFKLKSKTRDGARVHKVYYTPATPCDRLLAHNSVGPAIRENLTAQFMSLDPVRVARDPAGSADAERHGGPRRECGGGGRHTSHRGLRRQPGVGVEGRGSTANASQTAYGQTLVEDSGGSVRQRLAGGRGLVDCRAGSLGQGVDGTAGNPGSGRVCQQGTAENLAAPCQGVARRASEEMVLGRLRVSDGVNPRLFDGEDAVFGFAGVQT